MSQAERNEFRRERNRRLAAESRERRRIETELIIKENVLLRKENEELRNLLSKSHDLSKISIPLLEPKPIPSILLGNNNPVDKSGAAIVEKRKPGRKRKFHFATAGFAFSAVSLLLIEDSVINNSPKTASLMLATFGSTLPVFNHFWIFICLILLLYSFASFSFVYLLSISNK